MLNTCSLFESVNILTKQYLPGRRNELKQVQKLCVPLVLSKPIDLDLQEPHAHRVAHVQQLLLQLLHTVGVRVAVLNNLGEEVQVRTLAHLALGLGDGAVQDVQGLYRPAAPAAAPRGEGGVRGAGRRERAPGPAAPAAEVWVDVRTCSVRGCLGFKMK